MCDTGETVTLDDGTEAAERTLRAAIQEADAQDGTAIAFDIEGEGVHTIQPQSALPPINVPVELDATTQPGYDTTPVVVLDGSGAGVEHDGAPRGQRDRRDRHPWLRRRPVQTGTDC